LDHTMIRPYDRTDMPTILATLLSLRSAVFAAQSQNQCSTTS
jgi:hypothetical protein